MVEIWVLCTGKVFPQFVSSWYHIDGLCFILSYAFSFTVLHFQVFCPLLWSHSSKRVFLYLRFTGQKSIAITMYVFVFIIPHSYTVSVWKAASMRHGAGRRWMLGILLGRWQARSDPRGLFCFEGHQTFLWLRLSPHGKRAQRRRSANTGSGLVSLICKQALEVSIEHSGRQEILPPSCNPFRNRTFFFMPSLHHEPCPVSLSQLRMVSRVFLGLSLWVMRL